MATQNLELLKTELQNVPTVRERFAAFKFYTTPVGQDILEIPREDLLPVMRFMKDTGKFDVVMDLCGSDYLGNMVGREKRSKSFTKCSTRARSNVFGSKRQ